MRRRPLWLLAAFAVVVGLLGALVYPIPVWAPVVEAPELAATGTGDAEMYGQVVDRLAEGEPYYSALGAALREGDFPRRPVFNWRTPLHLPALALLRGWGLSHLAFGLLLLPGILVLILEWRHASALRITGALVLVVLVAAPQFHPTLYLFAEVWCGAALFLGFSLRATSDPRLRTLGALPLILALFLRELALPWLLVVALVDLFERRWVSASTLLVGLLAWCAWFGLHVGQVNAHLIPGVDDQARSWVAFGGVPFLLDSMRYFSVVTLAPRLAPLTVSLGVVAVVASWRGPHRALALAILAWGSALLIFGRDVNHYWGAVTVLPLALLFMARIIGDGGVAKPDPTPSPQPSGEGAASP
ncbi:MAG: hypothetical protein EA397_03770 [Deltaproteobacteria bacterium]|nr:MAG: hypothetical protein EA397_03770 [Deltaproteobacteria bacterium]